MKQNNWQLSLVINFLIYFLSNFLICPTLNSNSTIPRFGRQSASSASARAYRADNYTRTYNNRRNLQELQLATELAVLHNLNPGFIAQIAKKILDNNPVILPDRRPGFFRYELDRWEMIYNPITKEIHHLQPIRKRKR